MGDEYESMRAGAPNLLDRRTMLMASLAGAAAVAAPAGAIHVPPASGIDVNDFAHPFRSAPGRHDQIAMLVYPDMTILDIVGPYHFLCFIPGVKVHLVTNQPDLRPVVSDAGMGIEPTTTMADCPGNLSLLITPGGTAGTLRAARDHATLEFMRERAKDAKFISSVCSGTLILGAAGLLRGKRATSHWSVVDTLSQFGATPVHQRLVEDGRLITAAGVSAGLDLGALLVDRLAGRPLAEAAMLATEYAPEPPFGGGTLATARPAIRTAVSDVLRKFVSEARTLRPEPLAG